MKACIGMCYRIDGKEFDKVIILSLACPREKSRADYSSRYSFAR